MTPSTKTCPRCGRTHTRRTLPNGKPEKNANWLLRVYCSVECAKKDAGAKARVNTPPAPCVNCGGPIPRKPNEPGAKWRKRQTCSPECLAAVKAENGRASSRKNRRRTPEEVREASRQRSRARRRKLARLAPAGHKWNGKFPTPAGIKSTWASVTGPALAPVIATRGAPSTPPAGLTEVLQAHPDLATALAGELTDSWIPYSRTHSLKGTADATP
jgi:hypothetical protein